MQKTILSWGILALVLTFFAHAVKAQKTPPRPATPAYNSRMIFDGNHQYLHIDEDSSTYPPQIFATLKSDALYNMVISQGRLTSLYVNGRLIPADSFSRYDAMVKRIIDQLERDKRQAILDKLQAVRDKVQAEKDEEQAVRDKLQAVRDKVQAEKDREQALKDAEQAVRDGELAAKEAADAKMEADRDKIQAKKDREEALRDAEQAVRDREQAEIDKKQALRDAEQAVRDREQARRDKIQAEVDKALVEAIRAEVVKEGLAPDEKSVTSLVLDDSVFFVNGKRQSDELQKKFKEKFIKKPGYSIHMHNGTTNVGQIDQ